ncbi:MAG: hypothetical protein WDM90_11180, partial [Ferruginibacter sp.]
MARTKWLQNPGYRLYLNYGAALKIRVDSQYNTGLNASYAHLSDYYAKLNPDSALWYAQKMREQAIENRSPDDILQAIDRTHQVKQLFCFKRTLYDEFKKLNDSLQLSRDTTRNRFALIRYDVQKSKADNLVLQQYITRQRFLMYGFIAIAVIIHYRAFSLVYQSQKKNQRGIGKCDTEFQVKNFSKRYMML